MKRHFKVLALSIGLLGICNAASAFTFIFDENGNGKLIDNGIYTMERGYLQGDPTGGVTGPVLTYDLPNAIGAGDVAFYEPNSPDYLSDIFRFYNDATGGGHLIYYSDNWDGVGSLADIAGLPYATVADANALGVAVLPETGTEGGVQWNIYLIPNDNQYYGLSDTPAPTAIIPFALGLVGAMKRRKKAA